MGALRLDRYFPFVPILPIYPIPLNQRDKFLVRRVADVALT